MWGVFVMACLLTAFSPGPGVLLAVSNAAAIGPRATFFSSAGNATGVLVVAGLAASGVGTLLQAAPSAFLLLKLAGAGYMVWLGLRQWRALRRDVPAPARALPARALYREGLMVALGNPKSIVFSCALFAQFSAGGQLGIGLFLQLASTFAACTVLSHLCYVALAVRSRAMLSAALAARTLPLLSGAFFILLGLGMLAAQPVRL
jgi:threonine/homoserine/homoserine lactone efflux protein